MTALWLRYSRHFDFCSRVQLRSGSSNYYKDAERTEWASRLGEAFGYLDMQRRGYASIDHFEHTLIGLARSRQVLMPRSKHSRPDYYCVPDCRSSLTPALAEFKGHTPTPGNQPNIKGDLAEALKQAQSDIAFMSSPGAPTPPARLYAVSTYIRETGDTYPEPSLIAVTDPEHGDGIIGDIPRFPSHEIRESAVRGSYGAWLQMMGLIDKGMALSSSQEFEAHGRDLWVIDYRGHRHVFFSAAACQCPVRRLTCFRLPLWGLREDVFRLLYPFSGKSLQDALAELSPDVGERNTDESEPLVSLFSDGGIAVGQDMITDLRPKPWCPE